MKRLRLADRPWFDTMCNDDRDLRNHTISPIRDARKFDAHITSQFIHLQHKVSHSYETCLHNKCPEVVFENDFFVSSVPSVF